LVEGFGYGDGAKGGRPPFDPVSMFKALILQARHNLSDAKMEFMIRDRLSWMRFLNFDLGGPTPDENTIRLFRNKLTETGTLKRVMKAFDWQLQKKRYIPMSGGRSSTPLWYPRPSSATVTARRLRSMPARACRRSGPQNPTRLSRKL
jgi:transposase, IS5 family